ncbi:ATP-binding protein [Kribbella sp. NBC_00359]|uniref:ATP-binding protein n=1 Tax=Kribbella sp. NBC_00359 TaxID=2975966 RepID=UPI002E1C6256
MSTTERNLAVPNFADDSARRQVNVLFCDLVGSTELSERLDPEEFADVLDRYRRCVATVVQDHEGRLHHTLGDGVMASWGHPRAREDDAVRAVLAGLSITSAVAAVGDLPGRAPPLRVRVGIHTGIAVIADTILGPHEEFANIMGETPNLAARLQTVAEPGLVVISESTFDLVRERFDVTDLGPRQLRGVSRLVRVFTVRRPAERLSAPARLGRERPVVGRTAEMFALETAWQNVKNGSGEVINLVGDAGMGKSRLVQHLCESVRSAGGTGVVVRCSPLWTDTAFEAMRQFLMHAAGIATGDSPETTRGLLQRLCHDRGLREEGTIAVLANLLEFVPVGGIGTVSSAPEQRREQTFTSLVALLDSFAADGPAVIAFDDLHWADPSTAELVQRLVSRDPKSGMLFVLANRPSAEPVVSGAPTIRLGPLAPGEVQSLIRSVVPELPPAVHAAVVSKSDGVPLFVTEVARALARATSGTPPEIPPRLHDLLVARLDQQLEQRSLAQLLATIGMFAERTVVEGVTGLPQDEVRRQLGTLVEAGILVEEGAAHNPLYRFSHVLLREAAYSTLLRARRRAIHRSVAEYLRSEHETETIPAEVIAYHLEQAADVTASLVWWRRAALAAAGLAAHREAVRHLRHILDLLPAAGPTAAVDEVEVLVLLGGSLVALEGYTSPEANRINERARTLFVTSEQATSGSGTYYQLWAFHHVRAEFAASAALSQQLYERRGDAAAATMMGYDLFEQGNLGDAIASLERARRLAAESASPVNPDDSSSVLIGAVPIDIPAAAAILLGVVQWITGLRDTGRATIQEALGEAQTLGPPNGPFTRTYTNCYAAWWSLLSDDPLTAAAYAGKAIDEAAVHGYNGWLAAASMHAAGAATTLGDPASAAQTLEYLLKAWRDSGAEAFRPVFLRWLGRAYSASGDLSSGLRAIDEGIQHIAAFGGRAHLPELHRDRGLLLSRRGDRDAAAAEFRRAAETATMQGAWSFMLRAVTNLIEIRPSDLSLHQSLWVVLDHISAPDTEPDLLRARAAIASAEGRRRTLD